jgi:hypothetical protein
VATSGGRRSGILAGLKLMGIETVQIASLAEWPPALRPGALLLAVDGAEVPTATLAGLAEHCLEGAIGVFVCWGPGCERVHDIFEETEVVVQIDGRRPSGSPESVMSALLTDEPFEDALDMFGLLVARVEPTSPHVVVIVGSPPSLAAGAGRSADE